MKKLIGFIFIGCALLYGQNFDGSSLSMAGSYGILNKGIDAVGWNPAGLALPRGNTVELNFISLNSALFNDALSWNTYNRYFTAEGNPDNHLSESEKKDFLDLFSDNQLTLNTDLAVNVFGLAFNNFGLAVQAIAGGSAGTKIKPLEIALNDLNFSENYSYNEPNQIKGNLFSAVKISFAYAYPFSIKKYLPGFKPVSVGIGVNYYVGLGVAQVLDSRLSVNRIPAENNNDEYIRILAQGHARYAVGEDGPKPVGAGQGFDFGLSSGYGRKWRFALSFTNIGASINWSADTKMLIQTHNDSIPLGDLIGNQNNDNNDTSTDIDTSLTIGAFSTHLPVVMRIGGSYQIQKNWLVSAQWQQGLNKAFGNSTTPRLSAGTEYAPLSWLLLRSGMAIGGRESFLWGMGFGLRFRFVDFNFSYAMKNALWPSYSEGLFTAFSLKFKM